MCGAAHSSEGILRCKCAQPQVEAVRFALLIVQPRRVRPDCRLRRKLISLAVEAGRCREDGRGLAFPFESCEEPELVAQHWTAERSSILLVLERQHLVSHRIGGVKVAAAEIAPAAAMEVGRARFGLGIDLGDRGAPLGGIEPVGDDLKLRQSLAAVERLAGSRACDVLADLLAVNVELVLAGVGTVHDGVAGDIVLADAGEQKRQLDPVPAVERHLLHLLRIDVGRHFRGGRRYRGNLRRNFHRRAGRGRMELEIDRPRLPVTLVPVGDRWPRSPSPRP